MHYLPLLSLIVQISTMVIFNFKTTSDISGWQIVDDVVMGGVSRGAFSSTKEGEGIFKGNVSIENNGGFSSVRYKTNRLNLHDYSRFILNIKGDGKVYQFRVKSDSRDYFSYVKEFTTTKDWQTIDIPFAEMYPSFRGQTLDAPNYPGNELAEIAFLIANKKTESFLLHIGSITCK